MQRWWSREVRCPRREPRRRGLPAHDRTAVPLPGYGVLCMIHLPGRCGVDNRPCSKLAIVDA